MPQTLSEPMGGALSSAAAMAALDLLGVDEVTRQLLLRPDHVYSAQLAITTDAGREVSLPAWRVQHSNARGPYKGGLRFHPDVDLDEVTTLASLMSVKMVAISLPLSESGWRGPTSELSANI